MTQSDCEMYCLTTSRTFCRCEADYGAIRILGDHRGPGAVFDAHVRAEFVEQSVDATMAP